MQTFEIQAERRAAVGSAASRRLRREGRLPAILCGRGGESLALHVSVKDFDAARKKHARILMLQIDGRAEPAVIHDVAFDVITQEPAHVDFQRVSMKERIEIPVPVKVRGPSKGEAEGGILMLQMGQVRVRCLPLEIPEHLEADVRALELHQSLRVKDLALPKGVEAADPPDALVLAIVEKKEVVAPVAEAAEAAPTEPELISKAPKAEEGEEAEGAAPAKPGAAPAAKSPTPTAGKAEAPAREKRPERK
jgi:large subunit ribosomal protein L25